MDNDQHSSTPTEQEPVVQDNSQPVVSDGESVEVTELPSDAPATEPVVFVRPKKSHKVLLLVILVSVLILSAIAATYFFTKKSSENKSQAPTPVVSTPQPASVSSIDVLPQKGYVWLSTPIKVDPLPLFKDVAGFIHEMDSSITNTDAEYYKIGASTAGFIFAVKFPGYGGLGPGDEQLFVQATQSGYSILTHHTPSFYYSTVEGKIPEYSGPELAVNVKLDTVTEIGEIKTPVVITYKNQKFASNQTPSYNYVDRGKLVDTTLEEEFTGSGVKKVAELSEGTLYEVTNKDEPDYKISRFVLLQKSHFAVTLKLDGELSREEIEPITWADGSKNTVDFASGAQGCGQGQNNEIAKVSADQLKQIGKTTGGQKIYGFASNESPLLKKHYDEYAQFKTETYVEEAHRNLTLEQYAAKPELFLVEDGLGRFLVFESSKTRLTGGCAKPVVYLYPTSPTLVSVQVGADVTVSEPQYTATGWNNVLTFPNGLLGYNGKQYDSLFWEGYGIGEYPSINEGAVVAAGTVIDTLEHQLAQLGLNSKESSDFMAFWTSKIPASPYVRLTWFGTDTMEKLAPLYISPAPDTKIRVFLDMEGMDSYQQLQPQSLSHVPRRGFTVVEWGGLARDGSVPKLK